MQRRLRLGVLASGRGSNLQAIIDACEGGQVDAVIALVVSNAAETYALERGRRHGIEAVFIDPSLHRTCGEFDAAVLDLLRKREVELVCLAGYMRLLSPPLSRLIKIGS